MFLLIKGCNGFGNMISVLSLIYEIIKLNNKIILIIDWTHPEWELGFDNYFKLKNVNYMKYDDFKNIDIDKYKIFPDVFNKNNIFKPLSISFPNIDKENKYNELFLPVLNKINKINKIENEILVFSYNWTGYAHIRNLWDNLILNENIEKNIRDKINSLGNYNAIHIRHTDNKNEKTHWFTDYIKKNKDKKIYIATDNEIILNICKKLSDNIYNFTNFYKKAEPLHIQKLSNEEKNTVNIDSITDMYILVNSSELLITPFKTQPYMTTYSLLALELYDSYSYTKNGFRLLSSSTK
jgi:hypothetical protein